MNRRAEQQAGSQAGGKGSGSRARVPALRQLLGFSGNGGVAERHAASPDLAATYRIRVVAVGGLITASLLLNLLVYLSIGSIDRLRSGSFLLLMALGSIALGGVVLTPWQRVLSGRWGLRALYGWTVYGIAFVGVAIAFDGGGTSAMYLMFPVLTVFYAIAYPQRVQLGLFAVTVAVYLAAVASQGWEITAADLYMRLATLALLAYVTSVLSTWLISEMRDRARTVSTAAQRAGMLDTVARAARRVSSLDASQVLGGALSGAVELGCAGAEVWSTEPGGAVLTLQRRLVVDAGPPDVAIAQELFDRARVAGTTQVTGDGERHHVGCLLYREGEPAGLLLVRVAPDDIGDILFVECIELLAAQVSAGLDVARNVAQRRGLEEQLAHWAFHDSLTDLPNRVLFADRLELALARTVRDGSMVAVLFLDLDDFKGINDTLGHAAGDELLHGVAHRLHACLRPNDTLARYGGDEFVVLVEQIDGPEAAIGVATRILEALAQPLRVAETDLQVQTSIGIALTGARPGADADVMRRADMAMYEAKAAGGSCYVLSPTPDKDRGRSRRVADATVAPVDESAEGENR